MPGRRVCRSRSTGWMPTRSSPAKATSTPPGTLVDSTPDAELFLYPGNQHLSTDSSLPPYDEKATALLTQRVLAFLNNVDK